MKITLEISEEYKDDAIDKFQDFFGRVKADIGASDFNGLCGRYELETADMLGKAFANAEFIDDSASETNGEFVMRSFPGYMLAEDPSAIGAPDQITVRNEYGLSCMSADLDWWMDKHQTSDANAIINSKETSSSKCDKLCKSSDMMCEWCQKQWIVSDNFYTAKRSNGNGFVTGYLVKAKDGIVVGILNKKYNFRELATVICESIEEYTRRAPVSPNITKSSVFTSQSKTESGIQTTEEVSYPMRLVVDRMPEEPKDCPYSQEIATADTNTCYCKYREKLLCEHTSYCPYFVGYEDRFKEEISGYDVQECDPYRYG